MQDEESVLIQRVAAGDDSAFAILFERYKSPVYRFCAMILGDRATAEDVYQEIFLNFYRICRTGTQIGDIKRYLMAAARNRSLNALRIQNRYSTLDEEDFSLHLSYQYDDTATDLNEQVQRALAAIPPQYREAFVLFEFEGYSYEEISTQLGISNNVVRNRIYRARQALVKILEPLFNDNPR